MTSTTALPDDLSQAQIRIAELEAEVAVLRTARLPSAILESITDAFLAIDEHFRYVWVNAEAVRLLGTPSDQMIGRVMWQVFPDLATSNVYTNLHRALVEQVPMEFETWYSPWDRWFFIKVYPTKEGGLSLFVREVTEEKRVRQALHESEERLRMAFEASEGMVYDWSPRTGTVQRSGDLQKLIGVSKDEVEPTESWWQARIHPDDYAASASSVIARLDQNQNSFETEFRMLHADGRWIHIADRGFIIRDEDGLPIRVVGSSHDITERRRLERELKESNARLKFQADILASTDDAVIALDTAGCIRYCNAGAERLYAIRLSDVLGKPPTAIHPKLNIQTDCSGESTHYRSDGMEIIVSCMVNVLSPESGGGTVAIVRDISQQKRAEQAAQRDIEKHAFQLTRANEDLLHFAYAVSHDLQTPLRTVKSFAQLLALKYKSKLDEQASEFIRWIVHGSSRMDTMLHDLLQFAKVAGDEADFSTEVSLADALATALESLRSALDETQAIVTHDSFPSVSGDFGQFVQLFQNLLGNSLKYRKPDVVPRIHVSSIHNGSDWVISVRDNGIGFKPEYAERIFDVFQRLHKDEFAGTGIGLSICKRIVERRGGHIWATAQPDLGAVFSFSIPPAAAAAGRMQLELPKNHQLAESNQDSANSHFDELFHTLALAQAVVRTLDGDILVWTQGSERLFGWPEASALGKRLHDLIQTESTTSRSEIEASLLRTGEWTGECKARKRDGSEVWLASHCALYRDGSGRPQSVIEVHNDITSLKHAQAALLRSSEQRDLALTAGRMGIWRWDSRTGVVEWSETLELMLGMEPGSFEGTYEALQNRVHPDDRRPLQSRISSAFEHGPYYTVENRLLKNDGSYLWVRGQGKVLTGENNQPIGLSGVVWDISERKRNESNRQFLLDLSARLSRCSSQAELAQVAAAELCLFLGAARCAYGEIDTAAGSATAVAEYAPNGLSALGTYPLEVFGDVLPDLSANRTLSVADVQNDPRTSERYSGTFLPFEIRAFLAVPLYREDILQGLITVGDTIFREWQEREIALVRGVAERLWPALENARLLAESRRQQELFQETFEQAAVGMAHVGLDGRWLRVNQRICEITGYSREELLALRFQDITHPDDLGENVALFAALQHGEIPSYSMEKRYLHKEGRVVWAKLTVSIRLQNGKPDYSISVVEDITESKRTAEELQAVHRLATVRLREIEAIYSQAPVGLLFLDKDLRYVRINDHLANMNALPAADHIGRTLSQVLPELTVWLEPVLRRVMETRVPLRDAEFSGRTAGRPDREATWLVSYFPLEAPDGSLLGLNGVVQDITERKRAETASLETAERLRLATSAAKLGIFVWDADQDRAYWENKYPYEITGRDPEEGPVNNREFLERWIVPDDAAAHADALTRSMKTGEPFTSTCRIRRKDGMLRWVEFSGQFQLNPDGKPSHLTGVMADITDRIEADRILREQKQHLRRVLDSLFAFVGVLNLDGVLLDANRAPLEAAGIESSDVVGKLFPETYWWSHSEATRSRIWDSMERARAGETSRFDVQACMKGGNLVTLDWMMSPLRDDSGAITYLVSSAVPIEERKRTEQALRHSEERYLLAEWATNDGLWDWDTTTGDCYFSPRFKALVGLAPDELENRAESIFERLHPESSPILFDAVKRHWEEGLPYDIEIRILLKNGTYRWFRTRGKVVRNEHGQVVRMVGSMTDIHDRKEAEMLSQQHDEQLRTMIDSIEQLAWMAHADGYVFWYNRRWYEYTGTTPEQMEGWGWQTVHDPKHLPEVLERWKKSIQTGEPFEMEFPLLGADGRYRPFLTRIRPVRDSQGNVVRWFGTNTDVENLRREQDLLKESERKFRELAESLPELLWVSDAEGKMTYYNSQWTSYTGIPSAEGIGDRWMSIIHPDEAAQLSELWTEAVATGRHRTNESRMRRHDGAFRWFLHRAVPVRDEQGKIVKWLGTSTDIHEQKLTEQELRRSNQDLEEFAYAASHDLQEPLRTVAIYSQLLARRYGGAEGEATRFASYIVSATRKMEDLLKGFLSYLHVGEVPDSTFNIDSEAVLRMCLASLRVSIGETGAIINHTALPAVKCPESHLFQLFHSIIENALKYRSANTPEIYISAVPVSSAEGGRCQQFCISDNGIGIKREYSKQIFGMFKRLHRDEYPGVGVGLAICKRIVEHHGGRIWVESQTGLGTTFYFTLPAADDR